MHAAVDYLKGEHSTDCSFGRIALKFSTYIRYLNPTIWSKFDTDPLQLCLQLKNYVLFIFIQVI